MLRNCSIGVVAQISSFLKLKYQLCYIRTKVCELQQSWLSLVFSYKLLIIIKLYSYLTTRLIFVKKKYLNKWGLINHVREAKQRSKETGRWWMEDWERAFARILLLKSLVNDCSPSDTKGFFCPPRNISWHMFTNSATFRSTAVVSKDVVAQTWLYVVVLVNFLFD